MQTLTVEEIGEVSGGSDSYSRSQRSQTSQNILFVADNVIYAQGAVTIGYGLAWVVGVTVTMTLNSVLAAATGVAVIGSTGYLCAEAAYNSYYQ